MPQELPLWPTTPPPLSFEPDEAEYLDDRPIPEGMLAPDRHIVAISQPTLTVYRPENPASARSGIVICPGGGYRLLAIDKEGHHVARWLSSLGMVAAVCKYRTCPSSLNQGKLRMPEHVWQAILSDGYRGVRMLRNMAPDLGLDPANIGGMGFSAGAHLISNVCYGQRPVAPLDDAAGRESAELAFIAPIYPGMTDAMAARIHAGSPPAFLCDTDDDTTTPAEFSLHLYKACRAAGVSAELHLYRRGGHGFGMGPDGSPVSGWPGAFAAWLRDIGMID